MKEDKYQRIKKQVDKKLKHNELICSLDICQFTAEEWKWIQETHIWQTKYNPD